MPNGITSGIKEPNTLNYTTINPDKGLKKIVNFLEGNYKLSYYKKGKVKIHPHQSSDDVYVNQMVDHGDQHLDNVTDIMYKDTDIDGY
jgi:hypothetical protein